MISYRIKSAKVRNAILISFALLISSFISKAQNEVYLMQPFGGEYYENVSSQTINWQTNESGSATVSFSSDGGSSWSDIQTSVNLLDKTINWNVPDVNSTRCRIKIIPDNDALAGSQTSNFTIGDPSDLPSIILDEVYDEWANYSDIGGLSTSNSSFEGMKAFNNDQFLFIWLKRDETFSFLNDNVITLYIDTDDDASTGLQVNGIGAEIEFFPGLRKGNFHYGDESTEISFNSLFMVSSPTVISNQFELSINREAMINGQAVFSGDRIRMLLKDNNSSMFYPDNSGGAKYRFGDYAFENVVHYSIEKNDAKQMRIMSHNVEFDGFYEADKLPYFTRLYQSIQPDIIGFQEIYEHNAEDMVSQLEDILPSPEGKAWKASNVKDTWVASRYTIKNTFSPGGFGNGAFLLDLRPEYQTDLLLISAHPSCCDNDESRQFEVDAIAAFIRDAKAEGGDLTLAQNTPIVILGDMNFVGDTAQLRTLLHGDIVNEDTYGEDFNPDWNDESFGDAKPLVTNLPMTFTQGNNTHVGSYAKGRLDYMIYSSSVMALTNSYVCYTHSMPSDTLVEYGLLAGDTEHASDHFPVIADFVVADSIVQNAGITPLRLNNEYGEPQMQGQIKTVSGIVTAADELGTDGPAFIQDDNAGVALYGTEFVSQVVIGDSISVTGSIDFANGRTQLMYDAEAFGIQIHKNDASVIPQRETIEQVLNQSWDGYEMLEGMLVRIDSVQFNRSGVFESDSTYVISDGMQSLNLRIAATSNIAGNAIPQHVLSVIGLITQYDTISPYSIGYEIVPLKWSDFFVPQSSIDIIKPDANAILTSGGIYSIQWESELVNMVNILYKQWAGSDWTAIVNNFDAKYGEKQWLVPNIEDSIQIKVESADSANVFDVTGKIFIEKNNTILPLRVNDSEGRPVLLDQQRTITGIVTCANSFGVSGPGYIQDEEAGVAIYGTNFINELSEGDSVTVSGSVGFYNGLTELMYNENSSVIVHKNTEVPTALKVNISEILNQEWNGLEALEGRLIQIEDVRFKEEGVFIGNRKYTIESPTENITVYVDDDTDLVEKTIPKSLVSLTACLAQNKNSAPYQDGYQLVIRKFSDIENNGGPVPVIEIVAPTQNQKLYSGTDFPIEWLSENIDKVNIDYKSYYDEDWIRVASDVSAGDSVFVWDVPMVDAIYYHIKISDAEHEEILVESSVFTIIYVNGVPEDVTLYFNASLAPNPAKSEIVLNFDFPEEQNVGIELANLQGQVLKTMSLDGIYGEEVYYAISIEDFKTGIYLCKIKAGGVVKTLTFIKQ